MSNRTYICVECRSARRAPAAWGQETPLRCSSCGGPLWEFSAKWRIAPKSDDRAWQEMRAFVQREQPVRAGQNQKKGSELLARIDRKAALLSAQNPSLRRDATLKRLLRERADVLRRHFPADSPLAQPPSLPSDPP